MFLTTDIVGRGLGARKVEKANDVRAHRPRGQSFHEINEFIHKWERERLDGGGNAYIRLSVLRKSNVKLHAGHLNRACALLANPARCAEFRSRVLRENVSPVRWPRQALEGPNPFNNLCTHTLKDV